MMNATRVLWTTLGVLALCAAVVPGAVAQVTDIKAVTGGSSNPDSGSDIASAIGNSWNVPPYDCTTAVAGGQPTATFVVTKLTPPCMNKQYSTDFNVADPIAGDFGLTMQVGCDTGSGELTSYFGVCDGNDTKCTCVGSPTALGECSPGAADGNPLACVATCNDVGTCGGGNTCTGDAGRNCITDADCQYCGNYPDILCTDDTDCDFRDPVCLAVHTVCKSCGPLRGFCSGDDSVVCNPPSVPGPLSCVGTCAPAACGTVIPGFCDDNPNHACSTAADCGKCSNATRNPCETNADCDYGTCQEGLTNTDDGQTSNFFGILVRQTPPPPPDPTPQLTLLDPLRMGLLVAGLLTLGVALLVRRSRARAR